MPSFKSNIKRNPTIYDLIMEHLDRFHPESTIGITQLNQYSEGVIVQYSHSYTSPFNKAVVKEFRCAYYIIAPHTKDVVRKWDHIC